MPVGACQAPHLLHSPLHKPGGEYGKQVHNGMSQYKHPLNGCLLCAGQRGKDFSSITAFIF